MKKSLLTITITCIIALLSAQPYWYTVPQSQFNSELTWAGIGQGNSYEAATSVAKAELINQLSVNISASTEVSYMSTETQSRAWYTEQINQNVRTTSEHQVNGMEVIKQEQLGSRYYVMLGLDKQRFFNTLEQEIRELVTNIQTYQQDAQRFRTEGQIVFALQNYATLQNQLPVYLSKKLLYDSLAPRPYPAPSIIAAAELENAVRDIAASINFEIIRGNQQEVKRGNAFPEPIVFKASASNRPIPNLPVRLTFADGTLIENTNTNSSGEASVRPPAPTRIEEHGKVIIAINPAQFPDFYQRVLQDKKAEAVFKVVDATAITVRLSVKDSDGNDLPNTYQRLSRSLLNANVNISDDAPFYMRGVATIIHTDRVEGGGATRYTARAELTLQLGIVASNESLGSITGQGNGLSQRNEADAISQAYRNININERDVINLVRRAEGRMGN